ncbi:MAG: SMI1/KNR4 family protein [Bacteroidales bacterium]
MAARPEKLTTTIDPMKKMILLFLFFGFIKCANVMTPIQCLKDNYTDFYSKAIQIDLENVQNGLTNIQIDSIEKELKVNLPISYKQFLKCCGGFWVLGGSVKVGQDYLFLQDFQPYDSLTTKQKERIIQKGGVWPPPSQGMICFADFFMNADGDQVLFDVSKGLIKGEYPVYYYSHESNPPTVRKIADSFEQWLNGFPNYEEFKNEE